MYTIPIITRRKHHPEETPLIAQSQIELEGAFNELFILIVFWRYGFLKLTHKRLSWQKAR